MFDALKMVIPAVVVYTGLMALLARRRHGRPGGGGVFLRVALAGLAIGGALYYLDEQTNLIPVEWQPLTASTYRGLAVGAGIFLLLAAAGALLMRSE